MGTFWFVYSLVLGLRVLQVDWRTFRSELEGVFWPLLFRGGLVVAGLQGIWVAINSYLSR